MLRGPCGLLARPTDTPLTLLINQIVDVPKPDGEIYSLGGPVGCCPKGPRTSDLGGCMLSGFHYYLRKGMGC